MNAFLAQRLGESLALLAALQWTICAMSFTAAGRRIGSFQVNIVRLAMAIVLLGAYGTATHGAFLPLDAPSRAWLWLGASGFVGFFLGDLFLFRAFLEIGPRLAMLIMSLAPIAAAAGGRLWLGESLTARGVAGMALVLGGVAWVVLERRVDAAGERVRLAPRGLVFAVLGALGQGLGLVMAKHGMMPEDPGAGEALGPFAASQIRACAGLAGFFWLMIFSGRSRRVLRSLAEPRAMGLTALGAVTGPFLGVTCLLKAAQLIPTGIAQTLANLVPVMILPFVVVIDKEKLSMRSIIGAVVAVAGVALIFLQ